MFVNDPIESDGLDHPNVAKLSVVSLDLKV